MEVTPMSALYRSPYEAYPFLSDDTNDLRCDFELLTDELASRTGLLHSLIPGSPYQESLLRVCELIYHANPTLRTRFTITYQELDWFVHLTQQLEQQAAGRCRRFVLTQGCTAACEAHILRVQSKSLVRLLYRHAQQGHSVPNELMDFANLLSGFFFALALVLNQESGTPEIEYPSRNY